MVLSSISIEKYMLFIVKYPSFLLVCRRRYAFDCKHDWIFDGNQAQNHTKNQSKIIEILFYVGNVQFDAGEYGESLRPFLGTYRLEKQSKSHGDSGNSITIGIPIQMDTHSISSSQIHCGHHLQCPTSRIDCETNFLSILENFFSKSLYFCWKVHFCHSGVDVRPRYGRTGRIISNVRVWQDLSRTVFICIGIPIVMVFMNFS